MRSLIVTWSLSFGLALLPGGTPELTRAPVGAATLLGLEPGHGGGLNSCGCHYNRKTGVCHCHRAPACGCP